MIAGMADGIRALPPKDRIKALLLLALLALHVLFSVFFVAPGHYSIDEGIYNFMARALVDRGSLSVWNGYDEFASPELALPFLLVQENGALSPQYPGLYAFVAAPFYWAMGYRGLFALNALAFVGTLGLCFLIARRLFRDSALALNACLILALATFAWQYSQAAWPHALSAFIAALALYCAIVALQAADRRNELGMAFLAGLVVGVGAGVRLDAVFVLPAILLPFLFAVSSRPFPVLAAGMGLLPGLLALAAVNEIKFGIFSPFTYGYADLGGATSGLSGYLPLAATGFVCLAIGWLASRPAGRRLLREHRGTAIIGAAVIAAALLAIPQVWAIVARLADGALQLLVDLRFRDPAIKESGLLRSPHGAVIYLGSIKKSLLQSAPYLAALILPIAAFLRGRDMRALGTLFLVPAAYMAVYSYFAWHGGQAVNLRYFVPILPFLAILAAYAWRQIATDTGRVWIAAAFLGAVAVAIFHLVSALLELPPLPMQKSIYLPPPLAIAAVTGLLSLALLAMPTMRAAPLRGLAGVALFAGFAWSGSVAFTYDFQKVHATRQLRAEVTQSLAPLVRPDSIFFMPPFASFYGLIETPKVWFAILQADNFKSFRDLAAFHMEAGRAAYMWVAPFMLPEFQNRPLLEGLRAERIFQGYGGMLVRLTPAERQG